MLIYCSYNLIDQDTSPDWVKKLKDNPVVKAEQWSIYDPINGFTNNFERSIGLAAALAGAKVKPAVVANPVALKLDPMLLEPLDKVMARLKRSDLAPLLDVAFKNLYVIFRSDIVLVDLDMLGHGEASQEALYAYLGGVPVVGIAHRFILSPWMANKVNAVIFPQTTDEIVQQVLAYDHRNTAMIERYRLEREMEVYQTEAQSKQDRAQGRISRRRRQTSTTGPAVKPPTEVEPTEATFLEVEEPSETGAASEQTDGREPSSSQI